MRISTIKNKYFNKILSLLIWLLVWTLLAYFIASPVLLPSPARVLKSLGNLLVRPYFWASILGSVTNIFLGLILGFFLAVFLASLSHVFPLLENFIGLPIDLIKSTPLASITIVLLVWISSKNLSIFIVVLMVLPNIYYASLSGLKNTSQELLEMAQVFKLSRPKKIRFIYLDSLRSFLRPSLMASIGLAWKSGISAEVLALVKDSIGENIYYAKLYLNTAELFAWTLVIILLAKIFQSLTTILIKKVIL